MEKIVALAQRLTGNAELTSEDVLANLPHARRYVCRANGRQIYFGTDPAYAGRCPEGATRFDGVLAGAHYPVPRVHGNVLSPVTRRVTRPAEFAPPDPRIDAYESTRELLEETMADRDSARSELASARADLSAANAALANWPEVRPVVVPAPAPAPVVQTEAPGWLAFVVLLMLGLLVLAAWSIDHFRVKPLLAKCEELEKANTELQGKLMETANFLRTSEEDCAREVKISNGLVKRRARLVKAVIFYRSTRSKTDADLKREKAGLTEFRERRDRITDCHAKLAELRVREEPILRAESLVQEVMVLREAAQDRGDEDFVTQLDDALRIHEKELMLLGDPQELRAEINGLVAVLKRDMQLQCGLYFDTRSSDEWRAERDNEQRTLKCELEARTATYKELAAEVMKANAARKEEHAMALEEIAAARRELELVPGDSAPFGRVAELEKSVEEYRQLFAAMLNDPEEHVKQLIAYDNRETDLRKRLADLGHDPGPGTKLYALIAEQHSEDSGPFVPSVPRKPTLAFEALRESQLPMPPSTPTSALNRDIYKTLDIWRSLPPDSWTMICDERAARDWAYFLYNCWISVPRIGLVRLRHLLKEAKVKAPEWLTERARQPTGRPSV